MLALRALSAAFPTATDENTLLLPVPYSWNNGNITRPSTKGPIISFDVSQNRTTYNTERLESVWLKKNVAEKSLRSQKELRFLLVYFMGDHAFACTPMRAIETYEVSVHDGLRIDAKELAHVLTLTDDEERQILFDSDPAYKARMSRLRKN